MAGRDEDEATAAAVDEQLDALLGAVPTDLVEEQPEVRDPSDEDEAMAPVRNLRERGYGLP